MAALGSAAQRGAAGGRLAALPLRHPFRPRRGFPVMLVVGRRLRRPFPAPAALPEPQEEGSEGWDSAEPPLGRGCGGVEGASSIVQDLVDGLADGQIGLEALLDSTLEAVQDEWWGEGEARNNGEGGRAPESEKGQAGIPAFLYRTCLATAAYRVLVAGPPPEVCRPLSSLRLGPREALVRVLVVGHTGEEVVLVWRMRLEDSLEPVYKGLRVRERWAVVSVAGEPAGEPEDQRPDEPAPEVPPEAVVQAQLESLRDLNIQRCYNFASPSNRAAFKDDLAHFGSMLRTPAYQVLLGHASSEILETKQVSTSTFIAVCGINSNQGRAVFIWVCTLQPPGSALLPNCWLTDAVYRADSAAPVGRPADPT